MFRKELGHTEKAWEYEQCAHVLPSHKRALTSNIPTLWTNHPLPLCSPEIPTSDAIFGPVFFSLLPQAFPRAHDGFIPNHDARRHQQQRLKHECARTRT